MRLAIGCALLWLAIACQLEDGSRELEARVFDQVEQVKGEEKFPHLSERVPRLLGECEPEPFSPCACTDVECRRAWVQWYLQGGGCLSITCPCSGDWQECVR